MTIRNKSARRNFFAAVGLLGAAGVVAKVAGKTATAELLVRQDPPGDGYRVTEHIRKYYRTAVI